MDRSTTPIKCILTFWVFSILSTITFAAPKPAHGHDAAGRSKKGHVGRRGAKYYQNGTVSCATQAHLANPAPYINIWGGLTDVEAAGTVEWMFQQADLNLTVSESSSEWDNSM
jgi:primary-amine oxidase